MDISLEDMEQIKESFYSYFRQDCSLFPDVEGKSCTKGLEILSEKMRTDLSDIVFVGDEEKDMVCARNAGAYAVLINRDDTIKNYGQAKTIHILTELLSLFNIVYVLYHGE